VLLRIVTGLALSLALTWLLLVLALMIWRPRGIDLREAKRFGPDLVRLLRALASDPTLPRGVRRRLTFVLGYLALPFDLVPDFIPVLGYADDVIVVALILRSVLRRAGANALAQHWGGSVAGLAVLHRLAGLRPEPV
jgi:uncharacterized membrane protein YkvA (DUF1232 family)